MWFMRSTGKIEGEFGRGWNAFWTLEQVTFVAYLTKYLSLTLSAKRLFCSKDCNQTPAGTNGAFKTWPLSHDILIPDSCDIVGWAIKMITEEALVLLFRCVLASLKMRGSIRHSLHPSLRPSVRSAVLYHTYSNNFGNRANLRAFELVGKQCLLNMYMYDK